MNTPDVGLIDKGMNIDNHEKTVKPSQFLVDNIELLPRGRVLDLAMGNGRNSVYLAEMGFEVEGLDISEEAVTRALESARKCKVTITAKAVDLEGNFQIEEDTYDVIVCFNYLHRPLIPGLIRGLRRGGMVVYETFLVEQVRFGKPRNPDYLLKHNELLELFHDFRCLRYREGIFESRKAIASIIAEKT